jgi:hypothetical protein
MLNTVLKKISREIAYSVYRFQRDVDGVVYSGQ